MSLKEQIRTQMLEATRARDAGALPTLRMLHSAVRQQEIDSRQDADDQAVLEVVRRMVKQREESAKMYADGGREELAEKERAEIALLGRFLPQQMGEEDLDALIAECVSEASATSPKDMGKVMRIVKDRVAGRAEMSAVSAKVKQILSG